MAKIKKTTIKQLERTISKWDTYILKCIVYRDAMIDYKGKLLAGTVPPGTPPPNPPGIPIKQPKQ